VEYKDYYKILGVARDAGAKEIKAAYRKLARKFHPDVNRGDAKAEARFKEVNEANEVLSDPEKRKRYDTLGSNWKAYGGGAPPGWPGAGRGRVEVQDFGGRGFSDFFETFFGGAGGAQGIDIEELLRGARRGGGQARGDDVEYEVEVALEDVLRGTARALSLGEAGQTRKVEVKIPAGIREGARLRVPGEGPQGPGGGPRGDLYLRIRVRPHPSFTRDGDDLQVAVTVPLSTAVLGGEVPVPTLDGPLGIKVPAGTPAGRVFRLRGHGLPRPGGDGRGDVLAQLNVSLPHNLTERERELFEELRTLGR
jgi:DnaJ-class molecular chaperone